MRCNLTLNKNDVNILHILNLFMEQSPLDIAVDNCSAAAAEVTKKVTTPESSAKDLALAVSNLKAAIRNLLEATPPEMGATGLLLAMGIYGREAGNLTLREDIRSKLLGIFENAFNEAMEEWRIASEEAHKQLIALEDFPVDKSVLLN